jgi:hypothetical protein
MSGQDPTGRTIAAVWLTLLGISLPVLVLMFLLA